MLVSVLAVRPTASREVISSCVGVDGSTAALSTAMVSPPLTTVSPETACAGNEAIGSDSVTTMVESPDIVAVPCRRRGGDRHGRTSQPIGPARASAPISANEVAEPPHGGTGSYQR